MLYPKMMALQKRRWCSTTHYMTVQQEINLLRTPMVYSYSDNPTCYDPLPLYPETRTSCSGCQDETKKPGGWQIATISLLKLLNPDATHYEASRVFFFKSVTPNIPSPLITKSLSPKYRIITVHGLEADRLRSQVKLLF